MATNFPSLPSIIPSDASKSSSTSVTCGGSPSPHTGTIASSHSALESSSSSSRESSSSDTGDFVDSEMKYRLWFTWHLLGFRVVDNFNEAADTHRFWSCVSGTDPNEELWFWEDEDEEYIQTLTKGRLG
ncbi:hypothetical protein K438DRAFT_1779101 [Mycena galopus ATCC 62051]|nr:hypothetical protein K438DRAFT_1779101 [Mycena galopus ATCC 62051]